MAGDLQTVQEQPSSFSGVLISNAEGRLDGNYSHHYKRDIRCLLTKWKVYGTRNRWVSKSVAEVCSSEIEDFIRWYTKSLVGQRNAKDGYFVSLLKRTERAFPMLVL